MNLIRLINDDPRPGAWNMAIDQALLESADRTGQPILRFYFWEPATLSLGYFQSLEDRDLHSPSKKAPVVRRASGGGAILHDKEITYSISIPSSDRWSKRNSDLYTLIHKAITRVFADYSIQLMTFDESFPPPENPNDFLCFRRRSAGDLVNNDYKVVGSAQRRSKNSLLQHGSILLEQSNLAPELPGICDLNSCEINPCELLEPLTAQMCESLELKPELSEITSDERELATQLNRDRFGTPRWTQKIRH